MATADITLDSTNIPEIERLLGSNPAAFKNLRHCSISLTAMLHLAVAYEKLRKAGAAESAQGIIDMGHPVLNGCIRRVISDKKQTSNDPFGAPSFDLFRIGSADDLASEEWVLFYDRFRRRAATGRSGQMFRAVGGVLGEMGDNVAWHAFPSSKDHCPALAAFLVTDDVASFCVADAGIGFLKSLSRNTKWTHLVSEREALDAVVTKQATSRVDETSGGGFKQLFNSLLDFNGLVVLRSGDCTLRMTNSKDARQMNTVISSKVQGSEVTVSIGLKGAPKEAILK